MNPKKHDYHVQYEPNSRDYAIYDGNVVAYRGYDSQYAAELDLERITKDDNEVSLADFETLFNQWEKEEMKTT